MPSYSVGSDGRTHPHPSIEEIAAVLGFFLAIAPIFGVGYLAYEVLCDQFSWNPVFSFATAALGLGALGLALYRIRFVRITYFAIETLVATAWVFYAVYDMSDMIWASAAALAAACVGAVCTFAASQFNP